MAVSLSRRGAWLLISACVLLLASPVVFAWVQTERVLSTQLESLARAVPEKTELLAQAVSVHSHASSGCVATAAKQFGTELSGSQVADHFAQTSSSEQSGYYAAWFRHRRVRLRDLATGAETTLEKPDDPSLPSAARRLLSAYAMLPPGVSRVVLYSVTPIKGAWDPRCL